MCLFILTLYMDHPVQQIFPLRKRDNDNVQPNTVLVLLALHFERRPWLIKIVRLGFSNMTFRLEEGNMFPSIFNMFS